MRADPGGELVDENILDTRGSNIRKKASIRRGAS
jgi:hypothetical protein